VGNGNLRNAKVRKVICEITCEKSVKRERYVYAKSAFELYCAQYESDGAVTKTF